jgi:hypothetical protein
MFVGVYTIRVMLSRVSVTQSRNPGNRRQVTRITDFPHRTPFVNPCVSDARNTNWIACLG